MSNPKDIEGQQKYCLSNVPAQVLAEVSIGFLEGAYKYTTFNFRETEVFSKVYYDAAIRHLFSWFEGEDIDSESGLSHITKAICNLIILRDSQMQNMCADNRPPKSDNINWADELSKKVKKINEKYGK